MDEQPFDTINVIPFVDIMLVLLTIVLTTSSFIASGHIPIHLPQATASENDTTQPTVIEVDAQGAIHLNGQRMIKTELTLNLTPLPKDTQILIRADQAVALQHFIDVVDLLKQQQFTQVAVQTEQRQEAAP